MGVDRSRGQEIPFPRALGSSEDLSDESSLQIAIMHFAIIAVYVDVLYIQNINTAVFLVSTPLVFGDVFTPSSIGSTLYFDNFSYFYFGSSLIEELS